MPPTDIKLSVIALFYHGERWIDSCVRSLENQSLPRDLYEIILVDNGGSTPSVHKYKKQKNLNVIHFPENYGFAGGNNMALEHTRGEIIILMNQDVVVHHNCLKELSEAFDRYSDAGVISANMIMVSEKDHINPYSAVTETVGHYTLTPLGFSSYNLTKTEKDVIPVDFVSGNALGFRRTILKDIGNYLFDSRLVSYTEDLDFSLRLKKTKWQLYVWPRAVVYHYRDDAFVGTPSFMVRKLLHISSNRLMVYAKNLSLTGFMKKLPALLLGIPAKAARQDGDKHFYLLKFAIALGLTPLIFVYFSIRVLKKTKSETEFEHFLKTQTINK